MTEPVVRGRRGVLDTNTLIMLSRLTDTSSLPQEPLITAVTLAELSVGPLGASTDPERAARQAHLQQAEADFDPLPFDVPAARAFGRVAASLRRAGRKTNARAYDAMIAATAIANGLPVYLQSERLRWHRRPSSRASTSSKRIRRGRSHLLMAVGRVRRQTVSRLGRRRLVANGPEDKSATQSVPSLSCPSRCGGANKLRRRQEPIGRRSLRGSPITVKADAASESLVCLRTYRRRVSWDLRISMGGSVLAECWT